MQIRLSNIFVSTLLVFRNFFQIAFYPYKAMRKIAREKDYYQLLIINLLAYGYFYLANILRQKTASSIILSSYTLMTFVAFFMSFILTLLFFYYLAQFFKMKRRFTSLLFTFSYALLPTLIWFLITSLSYFFLPPPRTYSFFGLSFSYIFIVFSLIMLSWKIILFYLSLRFSLNVSFYKALYFMILYLSWFLPFSLSLYYLKIFRIPFI